MKLRYHSWQPLLVLVFLAWILLAAWRAFSDSRVNRASFQRIEVGMSKDQVSQILGKPADDRYDIKGHVVSPFVFGAGLGPNKKEENYQVHSWDGNAPSLWIIVIFDQRDEVACRYVVENPWWTRLPSWAQRLLPGKPQGRRLAPLRPPSPATAKANAISTKK